MSMGNFLLRVVSGSLPAMLLRSVHIFSLFLKSNCCDFGHVGTGSGAKKEWFCGVKILLLKFLSREKTVFEQKFAFSLVNFCSHAAISL